MSLMRVRADVKQLKNMVINKADRQVVNQVVSLYNDVVNQNDTVFRSQEMCHGCVPLKAGSTEKQLLSASPKTAAQMKLQQDIREINRNLQPLRSQLELSEGIVQEEQSLQTLYKSWMSQEGSLGKLTKIEKELQKLVQHSKNIGTMMNTITDSLLPVDPESGFGPAGREKHDAMLTSLYVNVLDALQRQVRQLKRNVEEWRINMASKSFDRDAMGLSMQQCRQVWCPTESKWSSEKCSSADPVVVAEKRPEGQIDSVSDTFSVQDWKEQQKAYTQDRGGEYNASVIDLSEYLHSCKSVFDRTPAQLRLRVTALQRAKADKLDKLEAITEKYKNIDKQLSDENLERFARMSPEQQEMFNQSV